MNTTDSTANDGGAAFPVLEAVQQYDDDKGCYREIYQPCGGMSLRDYFAAEAMKLGSELEHNGSFSDHAKKAYQLAEAMIFERKVRS